MVENRDLILSLLKCEVVRIGNFKLKTGAFSPLYIDLRRIINYPSVVKELAAAVRVKQIKENMNAEKVCGVPYTALPIASVFSVLYDVPMVMKRKEAKDYGTKKLIEGNWNSGDKCLIIEDIVSSGTSIVETVESLRAEAMTVQDCIVIINRNQGGLENAKNIGVTIYPLIDIKEVISVYDSVNKIAPEILENINLYFKNNSYIPVFRKDTGSKLSYSKRGSISNHPIAKKLYELMEEKKSNLCVAVDTTVAEVLLNRAQQLGPHICMLKTHIDMLEDFSPEIVRRLRDIADNHKFFILEDRKFADIGNTVKTQYTAGIYKISEWADIVTVHGIPGKGIVEALSSKNTQPERACVLVAEMSSKGNLINDEYRQNVFKMADSHSDFVIGYVAQQRNTGSEAMIHMCPGVNLESSGDSLGQQYRVPEDAVANGADVIIVGRGIEKAKDVLAAVVEYKTRGFNAYLKRIT